jgi:hypothetical protein
MSPHSAAAAALRVKAQSAPAAVVAQDLESPVHQVRAAAVGVVAV